MYFGLFRFDDLQGRQKQNLDAVRKSVANGYHSLEGILTDLNDMENFMHNLLETTKGQLDDVSSLKERILIHFSRLQYAKSIIERNKDPRYIRGLRSEPLDPDRQKKFLEIQQKFL